MQERNRLFMPFNAPFKWYNFIALMIHEVIIVERLWNDTDKAEPKDWEKLISVLTLTQIAHVSACAWTRTSLVKGRLVASWTIARPNLIFGD